MSTTINKTNGTVLTTIVDGAIDTAASDLVLIGKLYRNYGELVNENLVKLLENFANSTSPAQPIEGQLWYNNSTDVISVYRDTGFVSLAVLNARSSEPSSPSLADLWWDTVDEQLKLYNGSSWISIQPGYSADQGISGAIVETVQDIFTVSHVITKIYVGGTVVAIYNKDNEFTPSLGISGFSTIKKGLNLSQDTGFQIHGTSTDAQSWTTARTITLDGDLSGNVSIDGSVDVTLTATIAANSVALGTDTTGNYVAEGTTSGNGISGSVSAENGTFTVTSNATSSNTPSTIVFRDASGNFSAGTITATSSNAQYADLAEKYSTPEEYPVGTVMSVCSHSDHESCLSNEDIPIGVVSEKPAYLMNAEADGQALALKGRVPVRVIGAVKKGQAVYAGKNGIACTNGKYIVGISLESNNVDSEKLVECVLKL